MSAAVVTVFASFRRPPGSFSSLDIVPLWEFGQGEQGLGLAAAGGMDNQGLPGSDMEVTRAQGLRCDPAQPLHTNRNNWVARPGL